MQAKSQQIEDKIKKVEKQMDKLHEEAKQYLGKASSCKGAQKQMYKNKALMALNKKKQHEKQMKAYMNHQMTLDQLNMNQQSMKAQKEMMEVMEQSVQEQKKQMSNIDYDKMADIQDQMMDMKFQSDYMNQMLNRNYEMDVDEDQLDDELMEFEREIAQSKKKNTNVNIAPKQNIPANNVSYKNQDIDQMLKDL